MDPDLVGPTAPLRVALSRTEPAVSRIGAEFLLRAQQELTRTLVRSHSDDLDPVDAAAMVGAFVGAASGAVTAMIERPDAIQQLSLRLQRAVDQARAIMFRSPLLRLSGR